MTYTCLRVVHKKDCYICDEAERVHLDLWARVLAAPSSGRVLPVDRRERTVVMGILNVTPDSFRWTPQLSHPTAL